MSVLSPWAAYEWALANNDFKQDSAQERAARALEACHQGLHHWQAWPGTKLRQPPRGVYLWGPVGRGKTWLMDCFYKSLSLPARRQHFHHFMRWVHKCLFELTGTPEPLQVLAKRLSDEIRVLCLDEFFVADIGDAMILGRLMRMLFDHKVVVVTTSNLPPERLYAHGTHHDRFDPAIKAIREHMDILDVDGGEDHRLHPGPRVQRYWQHTEDAGGSALAAVFEQLRGDAPCDQQALQLGRSVTVIQRSSNVVWCSYRELCGKPLSANDYIRLCDEFSQILLSDVPCLSAPEEVQYIARGTEDAVEQVKTGDRVLPNLSKQDDGARRFIALVDECYDRGIPLYIEAEVAMNELYPRGYLSFPFQRTLSRLNEMQRQRFGKNVLQA
ncbi:cell division protein ZapE [Pokkaliibacter sp. MBI-7]|uniref:cell division protein ZapE n=1 Tax=Pokkaliibacter sp. MBI-7 TaxID=3040600 RepID=UPI002446F31A|nr:cell division protein ZapE [Pokkaliibacter sp. MBI-7]MDH2433398.1 cell division protein ZapE [Pokkaliibacter sp. MBI-7]